jgi:hypothetical protein
MLARILQGQWMTSLNCTKQCTVLTIQLSSFLTLSRQRTMRSGGGKAQQGILGVV